MANLHKDLFAAITKPAHFKVASALYGLADAKGEVRLSTQEISDFTKVSLSTLTRAFRDLEGKGFLTTVRSRKGFNKFSYNVYAVKLDDSQHAVTRKTDAWQALAKPRLEKTGENVLSTALSMSDGSQGKELSLSLKDERSTADTVADKSIDSQVSNKGTEILRISIPRGKGPEECSEEKLNSEAMPAKAPGLSVDPRDFRTRGRRPVESWTTWDIAAEFADELQKKFSRKPLLINKKQLAEALRPMRSRYGSTSEAEMWLMKIYFMDQAKVRLAETAPSKVIGAYLNLFKTHLDKAIYAVSQPKHEEFVYADDGREFDNSIPGRLQRDRYNANLKIGSKVSSSLPETSRQRRH